MTVDPWFTPAAVEAIRDLIRGVVRDELERIRAAPTAIPQPVRKRLFSVRKAAPLLDVSHPILYRCLRSGMPCVRVGASTKIDLDEAIAWLREHGAEVTR